MKGRPGRPWMYHMLKISQCKAFAYVFLFVCGNKFVDVLDVLENVQVMPQCVFMHFHGS